MREGAMGHQLPWPDAVGEGGHEGTWGHAFIPTRGESGEAPKPLMYLGNHLQEIVTIVVKHKRRRREVAGITMCIHVDTFDKALGKVVFRGKVVRIHWKTEEVPWHLVRFISLD